MPTRTPATAYAERLEHLSVAALQVLVERVLSVPPGKLPAPGFADREEELLVALGAAVHEDPPALRKLGGEARRKAAQETILRFLKPPPAARKALRERGLVESILAEALSLAATLARRDEQELVDAGSELLEHHLERLPTDADRRKEAAEELKAHREEVVFSERDQAILDDLEARLNVIAAPRVKTHAELKEEARRELQLAALQRQRGLHLRRRERSTLTVELRTSTKNRATLLQLTEEDCVDADMSVAFEVHAYDGRGKAYYKAMHTGDAPIEGALVDVPIVGPLPEEYPPVPANYRVEVAMRATKGPQTIHLAHAVALAHALSFEDRGT